MGEPFRPVHSDDCPICRDGFYVSVPWERAFRIAWDFGALMFWAVFFFMVGGWLIRGHLPPCGW